MIDLRHALVELSARGINHERVASFCNCSVRTVAAIASGERVDPRYSIGAQIEMLYELCVPRSQIVQDPPE